VSDTGNNQQANVLDLSGDTITPQTARPLASRPYDPAQDREQARGRIAFHLLYLLSFIVVGSFVLLALSFFVHWGKTGTQVDVTAISNALKSLIELLFTPIIGLVGAATGFYFGEKSGKGQL